MAFCRECGSEMDWGYIGDKWIPLEPTHLHGDLDRRYKDENGALRADHRDRHGGDFSEPPVALERLPKKVTAARAEQQQPSHPVVLGTPWWKRFGRSVAT
jgi:hypothetical protein